ncbi:MAG TPA: SAM-dependent chlorinase/fluorinase [Candidatus Didemnitutus sp.]|nr:SAM-dependent chlorinase/fluorinase [Candidatus Didemnitutus sp.]
MTTLAQSVFRLSRWPVLGLILLAGRSLDARNAVVIQADFGGAVMPGVCYSVSKDLDIFTVQPLIPLYDIDAASRNLIYTAPVWPAGTVFVSVVDPGVGTTRKSVVLKTRNGQYFVSPDNGTLTAVADQFGIEAVREIDEKVNRRPGTEWSNTFHGRDVYSYTAARLAAGVITFEQVGPLLEPKVVQLEYPPAKLENGTATGMIYISKSPLGNTASIINRKMFAELGIHEGEPVVVTIRHGDKVVWEETVPYARTFGEVPLGKVLMFINSSGCVAMAINQGNFADRFNIDSGRDWTLSVRKK